jgi:GNAT superfamily N-acetyltransferase
MAAAMLCPANRRAKIALLVVDEHQGRGVGTGLAEHLCGNAARRGIRRLDFTALAGNTRAIRLFRGLRDGVDFGRSDAGVVAGSMQLDRPAIRRPARAVAG